MATGFLEIPGTYQIQYYNLHRHILHFEYIHAKPLIGIYTSLLTILSLFIDIP